MKLEAKIEGDIENMLFCYMSRPKTNFEPWPHSYESPVSSFIQCQLISTQTQLNLNSILTKLQLNLISTSTSTLTLTQYVCDIRSSQSSNHYYLSGKPSRRKKPGTWDTGVYISTTKFFYIPSPVLGKEWNHGPIYAGFTNSLLANVLLRQN